MTPRKPLPWSHSSLSTYESCPKKYFHLKVIKDIPDPPGEAAIWGDEVHKALEARLLGVSPLPPMLKKFEPYCTALENIRGTMYVEHQMAITRDLEPCDWDSPHTWARAIVDVLHVDHDWASNVDHKGLPLDTEIPTPIGWRTMAELKRGDLVFGSDGKAYPITVKSDVHHRPCYEVEFDDKSKVVCDNVHLWETTVGTVPVTELTQKHKVLVAKPAEYGKSYLPIHPYVLGLWIADGKHSSAEVSKPDQEIWDMIESLGYELGLNTGSSCTTRTIKGIRADLIKLGLHNCGAGKKFIPEAYLTAGYEDRLELLRGLMDGDGSVNETRKQAVFSTCTPGLAENVAELLASLGQRPSVNPQKAFGFGKHVTAYQVNFRPQGINPFRMSRKADRIDPAWGRGNSWRRRVVAVREVPSVPTQCIGVASPDRTYLCTRRYVPTHNTGKVKPSNQLMLSTLLIFIHFPQVQEVKTGFMWLAHGERTIRTFTREQIPEMWQEYEETLQEYEQSFATDNWPARQSGLCKGWCPVRDCIHWGPPRRKY